MVTRCNRRPCLGPMAQLPFGNGFIYIYAYIYIYIILFHIPTISNYKNDDDLKRVLMILGDYHSNGYCFPVEVTWERHIVRVLECLACLGKWFWKSAFALDSSPIVGFDALCHQQPVLMLGFRSLNGKIPWEFKPPQRLLAWLQRVFVDCSTVHFFRCDDASNDTHTHIYVYIYIHNIL